MGGIGLRYGLQQPQYSLSIIVNTTIIFLVFGGPLHREPIVVCFSNLPMLIADPPLLCLRSLPYTYQGCLTLIASTPELAHMDQQSANTGRWSKINLLPLIYYGKLSRLIGDSYRNGLWVRTKRLLMIWCTVGS
jgi:hypothetical protein